MIRRQACVLRSFGNAAIKSTSSTNSLLFRSASTLLAAAPSTNFRQFCSPTSRWLKKSSNKKSSSAAEEEETSSSSVVEEETITTTTTTTTSSSSASKSTTKSSSTSSSSEEKVVEGEEKSTEKKSAEENSTQNEENSSSSEVTARQDDTPEVGTVEEYSRIARSGENRLNVIEAEIWHEDSCYHPILARGKQNVYEHTDDIPQDVKPMFGDTQIWQTREYFEYRRKAEDIRFKMMYLGSGFLFFFGLAAAVAFTRIWIDQPNEVATIRRDLLSHSYGRVLELAAGQGINIGIYPYAVTDVVLMDSNPQELHILRSRLPRTAYPTYQVVCDKAEELAAFPDNCFDTVVDMFGLCHYKDPVKVLKQMQRVCKPTGSLLLLEHGKTQYSAVNWFLDWYADSHFEKTNGCQWNKDLMGIFKEAGLVIRNIDTQHYGTTHIVIAHPEVQTDAPLLAGGQPAPAIMRA